MKYLYQSHIDLMIFLFFSPKDTLCISFTFAGKVQQCLITVLLLNIYLNQKFRVRWDSTHSQYFNVSNGVKQRGARPG